MSIDTAWKCLSVEDFIGKCNWENISIQKIARPQKSLASWQCLSTQYFFELNNWTGVIISDDIEQQDLIKQEVAFDLTLTTSNFWQYFNWSGKLDNILEKKVGEKVEKTIEDTEKIIAVVEEFTLNNLTQLF